MRDCEKLSITKAALREECGPHIADVIVSYLQKNRITRIPNFDQLMVGDIVLSRQVDVSGKPKISPVCDFQKEIKGFNDCDSCWSHAMVYVGNLHLTESQKYFPLPNRLGLKSGTRVASLLYYAVGYELKICRYRNIEDFPDVQANIGRYALLDIAVNRRKYSVRRIMQMLASKNGKSAKVETGKAIICSEYVLECMAIGGACMTDEYNDLGSDQLPFFFPADFHKSEKFVNIDLDYISIVD